jgi:hypothetical protein
MTRLAGASRRRRSIHLPGADAGASVVGAMMLALLGWHVAFLSASLGELVPVLNLSPTWTAAVVFVAISEWPVRSILKSEATPPLPLLMPGDS